MYKYPITIELLSETIFGNGQSKNGIVNTDVLLDEEGFPYYLGKTFKGCLKKSINTILKPYYKDRCEFNTIVNKLFGISEKGEQREGKLKFSNFYLDKKITDIFNECECMEDKKNLILSSLTDIRFGIKMGDNGVSESKSLRASRVLKKGLVFNGFVECEDELKKDEYMILEKGVKSLKNLGVNKSRGKGLVQVKIGKMIKLNCKNNMNVDCNFNYLLYEINLKQPVKIGDSQSQYDYEQTKSYISGSIVRGAVIGKYLKSKGIKSRDTEEDVYFNKLLKKVCFYDAYPIYEERKSKYYSFPTPNIFRTTKNIDKEDRNTYINDKNAEFSIVFSNKKVNNEPTVIKLKKGDFSYYRGNILYQFNIKKDYRFHHSQQKEEENIFRYESIAKGQKFYGIVDVSHINSGLKKEIYNLLKEKEILYLGGSRTSGYGKTEICNTKTIKDFDELKEVLGYFDCSEIKDKLNIYFLSDSILRDENHQIVSCFSKKYLNKKFNINITEDDIAMEISPVILTGYNSTWKSFIPHVYGIEKGSVIKIDLSKAINKIDKDIINEFIISQKGDRKQDGLGRVIINPKFLNTNKIKYEETNKPCKFERENSFCPLSDELISSIKEYRDKVIIDKCININTISKLKKDNKNSKDNISNTQINNIIAIINRALLCNEDINPMDEIKDQIKRLNKVTQNKEKNNKNDKILNYEILLNKSLRYLVDLSKEKIDETVKDILLRCLKESNRKENIVKEIVENNSKDKFKNERIVLNAARDVFYYSIKAKEGEYVG